MAHHPSRSGYKRAIGVVVLIAVALLNGRPLALAGIHVYQATVAPVMAGAGMRCRFTPSCSRYAEAVIARDGVLTGGWRAIKRIARCGPWTPPRTVDEP
jgi:putative membrane protein insertion efficiency factor